MNLVSEQIVELIGKKHAADVFIPECKEGKTWNSKCSRLDAWAMKRSWSPLTMTGYEVKVSRSDFINDDKWPNYLPLCHQLYFVCPHGLIDVSEVPEGCGLMYAAKTGTRLYTKKKAPRRDIELPGDLMAYALMRADSFTAMGNRVSKTPGEIMREWVESKAEDERLCYLVSKRIRDIVDETMFENARLVKENERLAEVKKLLDEAGVDLKGWNYRQRIEKKIVGGVQEELQAEIESLASKCEQVLKNFKERVSA